MHNAVHSFPWAKQLGNILVVVRYGDSRRQAFGDL